MNFEWTFEEWVVYVTEQFKKAYNAAEFNPVDEQLINIFAQQFFDTCQKLNKTKVSYGFAK